MHTQNNKILTLGEHFRELRIRIIICLAIFTTSFLCCWVFRDDLLFLYQRLLWRNLLEAKGEVILIKIIDKFYAHVLTSFFVSVLLSMPFLIGVIAGYITPALNKRERKNFYLILSIVILLFYSGILLAYFVVLPITYQYLISYTATDQGIFSHSQIRSDLKLSLKDLVSITQKFLLTFGIIFQTPLIMLLVNRIGLVKLSTMLKYRRHLYVMSFAAAAILTPPDPLSMILLAIPLIFLVELGIILCRVFNRNVEIGDLQS